MVSRKVGRRRFVAGTAAASTAFVAAPFVRGAYAAGKLSVGFWDHWVPNANGATETLIREWADKEKVEVQIDFITSQGNKLLLTTAAEAQERDRGKVPDPTRKNACSRPRRSSARSRSRSSTSSRTPTFRIPPSR